MSAAQPQTSELTEREKMVAVCIAEDLSGKEVAARLCISQKTVEFHVANIKAKIGVRGPAGIARYVLEQGLIATTAAQPRR